MISFLLFLLVVASEPAVAQTTILSEAPAVPAGNFNGGNFQVNMSFFGLDGANAFINAVKGGSDWVYSDYQGKPLPNELDANGYPLPGTTAFSHGGVLTGFQIPSQSSRPGYYAIDWHGGCTIGFGSPFYANTISGSGTSSPWIVDPARGNLWAQTIVYLKISANSGGCTDLRMYSVGNCRTLQLNNNCGDYDALTAGKSYVPHLVNVLKHGKVGLLRFFNWQVDSTVDTTITNWSHNKPLSYVFYNGDEYRASLFATPRTNAVPGLGPMTNVGNAYSITCATGTFCAGPPTDKEVLLVQWNATASTSAPVTLSLNGGPAIRVVDKYAGNGVTGTGSGYSLTGLYSTEFPLAGRLGAVVYDAGLNLWLKWGGDSTGQVGLINRVPPAAMMELCNEVGAHCWFLIPALSLDPDQGYATALAQLAKQTLLAGIKLFVEPPDETWNTQGYFETQYAIQKAGANWPSAPIWGDLNEEYGKWVSIIGQSVSTVFGGDKSKYSILDCVWTNGFTSNDTHQHVDSRFTSANYVTYDHGPSASNYVTDLCVTGYFQTSEYNTGPEIADAWNYVTSTSSTQQAIINTIMPKIPHSVAFATNLYGVWGSGGVLARLKSSYGLNLNIIQYEGGWTILEDDGHYSEIAGYSWAYSGHSSGTPPWLSGMTTGATTTLSLGHDQWTQPLTLAVGQPITLAGTSCPSWAQGTFTVQGGVDGNHPIINLNSTGQTYKANTCSFAYVGLRVAIVGQANVQNSCVLTMASPMHVSPGFKVWLTTTLSGATGNYTVHSASSDGLTITLANNCTQTYTGSPTLYLPFYEMVNILRQAVLNPRFSDSYAAVVAQVVSNNNIFASNGGTFPSIFDFSGALPSGFHVFAPNFYATPNPNWPGFLAGSGGTYPYLLKRDIDPAANDNTPLWLNETA